MRISSHKIRNIFVFDERKKIRRKAVGGREGGGLIGASVRERGNDFARFAAHRSLRVAYVEIVGRARARIS